MKNIFNVLIFVTLILVRSFIFSQTINNEQVYVFFTFPPYLQLVNMTPEILILSIIWNSPIFYLMYSSFKMFSSYIRENFIYFLIRNSNVRKTLLYIIRKIVLLLIVSLTFSAIIVIIVFNQFYLIVDAEYICSVLSYLLFSIFLIFLPILAYLLTLQESVVAWFIMVYMIVLTWISYMECKVVLDLLFQVYKTEFLSNSIYIWLMLVIILFETIYFVARKSNKLF